MPTPSPHTGARARDGGRGGRTLLVGDVHGCARELDDLLEACEWTPADEVVLVGDLVAKGPDSVGVVRRAMELGARAVRGNHEHHVLTARGGPLDRLRATHRRVVEDLDDAQWRYLESLPLYLELPEHHTLVVHAGFLPGVPLAAQREGDMLTMRSIQSNGVPSKRIEDGTPWASLWQGPAHVVFGHNATSGLQQHPFATGLDTGCVYGRRLTAYVLPERRLVSVPARDCYAAV